MEPLRPTDPVNIGKYRLTHRLGAGGMGQVYLARTRSSRVLVVKVVRADLAAEDGFRARFAREAEAARRVGGFHTAQVVDADPDTEAPWIAAAHIPGPTLERAVRAEGSLSPSAVRALAVGLAEGLDAIHACDLVHRDLKPGNIILAEDGPRIIDFGIARPLDADSMTTQGAVFGTLPYMSPEQTDGSRVGPASDVFSLGTVLAYAATSANPFTGATMAETVRRLISPPPDLGGIAPDIRELIADCWNHDPALRPTPDQILNRFDAPDPDLDSSWPSPHGFAPGPAQYRELPSPTAAEESTPSLPPGDPHSKTAPVGTLPPTKAQPPSPDPGTAVSPPSGADSNSEGSRAKRGWYVGAAIAVALVVVLALLLWISGRNILSGHDGGVLSVAFSPDGTTLATGGSDDITRLWNTDTRGTIATLTGHDDYVASVAFSPDGTTLATGGRDGTVRLWDVDTGETIATLTNPDIHVRSVAFNSDGTTLAAGGRGTADGGTVDLWDVRTGETIETLAPEGIVDAVAFGPDGTTLATGSGAGSPGGTAELWDIDTGETIATLTGHDEYVASVAFSPDGTTLATGSGDHTVRLWETDTGETIATLTGHEGGVQSVEFSPDGTTLATGSSDDTARLWNTDTGETIATLTGHDEYVASVAFSPDGTTLATGSSDETVRLWDIE